VKLVAGLLLSLLLAASAEARKISVAVPVLDVTQSALYVARERGYYQQEGLDVELILMRGGVANQALIAGNAEFTTVPTAGLQAALQGASLKVVLSTFHKFGGRRRSDSQVQCGNHQQPFHQAIVAELAGIKPQKTQRHEDSTEQPYLPSDIVMQQRGHNRQRADLKAHSAAEQQQTSFPFARLQTHRARVAQA
jgi:hypothetical protein